MTFTGPENVGGRGGFGTLKWKYFGESYNF